MSQEIEIKLKLDDAAGLRRRLTSLGAKLTDASGGETNLLFDDASASLRRGARALRLRRARGQAWLTYKGRKSFRDGVGEREEIESLVGDADGIVAILAALGLRPVLAYAKQRESWTLGAVKVEIDRTSAGDFVEIEGPDKAVREAVSALGFSSSQGLRQSYPRLIGETLPAGRPDKPA